MARRRYVSTQISQDIRVNRLGLEYGDFAALLYTWMIPHAADDATLPGDPEELMYVVIPGRRDKTVEEVAAALAGMRDLGLIEDAGAGRIGFPARTFYKYQTYVACRNRAVPATHNDAGDNGKVAPEITAQQRPSPMNTDERRTSAQKAVSPSPSPSPSPSERRPPQTPPPGGLSPPAAADGAVVATGGHGPPGPEPLAPVPRLPRAAPKPSRHPPPDLAAAFDRFWQAWPKRVGRAEALAAFAKLRPTDDDVGRIVAAIAVQSEALGWPRDRYRYCPNPATWLTNRRWEDEPPEDRQGSAHGRPYASTDLDASMALMRSRRDDVYDAPPRAKGLEAGAG